MSVSGAGWALAEMLRAIHVLVSCEVSMERRIVAGGAVVAGGSIFLPYVRSPELFDQAISLSGAAIGKWIWAIPLMASIALAGHFLFDVGPKQQMARRLMLGGAGAGIAALLFGFYELTRDRLLGFSAYDMGFRPGIGAFAGFIGFVLALTGAWRLKLSANAERTPIEPVATGPAHGELGTHVPLRPDPVEEGVRYAKQWAQGLVSIAGRLRAQVRQLDLPARYRRSRKVVWGVVSVLVLALFVRLALRPSPEKLGNSTALAFSSCQDAYAAEVRNAEQTLLQQINATGFRTRGEALDAWSLMLQERRPRFQQCMSSAGEQFAHAEARFRGRRLARFLSTHSAQPRPSLDPTGVENGVFTHQLQSRIQAIRAASPSEADVRGHLLGQHIDGWSFDDPSEIRAVRLSNVRVQGDTLRLRADVDLTDYVSQEPYVSVLELRYREADRGEWELAEAQPLLVARAGADYRVNGEIFLVGRWRWPGNYAVYNPDGTWAGRWDNGSEVTGRWRIVRDQLMLTRGGTNWWSGPIQAWNADSMTAGAGSGVVVHRWQGPEQAVPPVATTAG